MLRCQRARRWMRPCYSQRPRISQRTQSTLKRLKGKTKFCQWFCAGPSPSDSIDWVYLSGHNKAKFGKGRLSEKLLRRGRTGAPAGPTQPTQQFRKQPRILSRTIRDPSQQRRQTDTGSSPSPVWQVTPSLSPKSSFESTSFISQNVFA